MDLKKLDIKTVFIIILSLGLIISFFLGQKNKINYRKDEIKELHAKNDKLLGKNDSLFILNDKLEKKIAKINLLIEANNKEIAEKESQIQLLKKRKNEIPNHVNVLSANGVASSLTKYIERTKSTISH
jgi:regulator of replication initiation timing